MFASIVWALMILKNLLTIVPLTSVEVGHQLSVKPRSIQIKV